jgi:hypothetical protein
MQKQIVYCLVAVPILILMGSGEAQAKILTNYDLASLYEMGSDVIEATELSYSETEMKVQVERVYKGELKPGAKIDILHNSYRRELWPDVSSTTIQPFGEPKTYTPKKLEVINTWLFLQKAEKINTYTPVPSGIILIRKSDVLGYKQQNNPGPYFLRIQKQEYLNLKNNEPYTVKELRMDLEQAIKKVEKFHQILEQNSWTELNSYLPLHPSGEYNGNWLARKAAEKIAATAAAKEIEQILLECKDKCEVPVLQLLESKLKK